MSRTQQIAKTERLKLRCIGVDDAAFILELLNQPSFIRNIGDKGVRTLEDAKTFIRDGPVASYREQGFGMYMVELTDTGVRIGICGLVKRDGLPDADVGFAFLPAYWSCGYASESALAVRDHATNVLGLNVLLGITSPGNQGSARVLQKIGFRRSGSVTLPRDDVELELFVYEVCG